MNQSSTGRRRKLMLGFIFVGGVALILGIFRAAKNVERSHQQIF